MCGAMCALRGGTGLKLRDTCYVLEVMDQYHGLSYFHICSLRI